jgi:hypothetical protein
MKALEKIKVLEDELALLKADLTKKEAQPIAISESFSFLVHPTDLGEMNWDDAMKACADLGDGWRLPTRLELLLMYNNQDELGGFAFNSYWSSTEHDNVRAWIQNFFNGFQSTNNKTNYYYVRAVRDNIKPKQR